MLAQTSREQTALPEHTRAVQFASMLRLLSHVKGLSRLVLHAERKLHRANLGVESRVVLALLAV